MTHRCSLIARALAAIVVVTTLAVCAAPASASATATVAGTAFKDLDRDGVQDDGEPAWEGHKIYLFGPGGSVASTVTAADGRYAFMGLGAGEYRVKYDSSAWRSIRQDWVPTTTGSVWPDVRLTVEADAIVDFGWRRIVHSTTLGWPVSTHTGPSGLTVESYNDAVTAAEVHDALLAGSLVGGEAAHVKVRFGHGTTDATTSVVGSSGGVYTSFSATVGVTWLAWLDTRDGVLFHEYGHAWSSYYSHLVQQDPDLSGYLEVRGLLGDPRVNSTYGWSAQEMIAEDYRQLFGTATAAAAAQMNREVPPASEVPGLAEYLAGPFREAPVTDDSPADEPTLEDGTGTAEGSGTEDSTDSTTDTTTKGNGGGKGGKTTTDDGGGKGGGPKK